VAASVLHTLSVDARLPSVEQRLALYSLAQDTSERTMALDELARTIIDRELGLR
jgi:hypothetical protein